MCDKKIKEVLATILPLFCVVATAYASDTPQAVTSPAPLNKDRPVVSSDKATDNSSEKLPTDSAQIWYP
jgi:hypothetical protein